MRAGEGGGRTVPSGGEGERDRRGGVARRSGVCLGPRRGGDGAGSGDGAEHGGAGGGAVPGTREAEGAAAVVGNGGGAGGVGRGAGARRVVGAMGAWTSGDERAPGAWVHAFGSGSRGDGWGRGDRAGDRPGG